MQSRTRCIDHGHRPKRQCNLFVSLYYFVLFCFTKKIKKKILFGVK